MNKLLCLFLLLFFLLSGCSSPIQGNIKNVGLLVPETINDQVWGTKGYTGMLKIQSKFNTDVFYKENMKSEEVVRQAVEEFEQRGVNLIFGHGDIYAQYFNELGKAYPDIQFICFNGDAKAENVTSLNFEGHAMGFFGGMVAGEMTQTNKVGVISAFEWQPEVNGFFEGALYENADVDVDVRFVKNWDDIQTANHFLDEMIAEGVDVVYPAGDGFNVPLIEELKAKGLYAIGYITEQSDLGENTVLTSTVQRVDALYELVAKEFNEGTLQSGNLSFDFQDDVISVGKFSPLVADEYREKVLKHIETYKRTGNLPNQ
ncbi:BMP family ABC transporter substrate-binding protein [Metabacillus iocasae]|uniref:Transcriptional activator of comK protein n=1 Tax=Priestia iocasae TaxID=2291674 RepID=A0ABS2QUH5_9BACI|nr:BMP family ABC transporter substrate-binding protein [Metabacillus iocasae]MBM7702582.1 transcriptional activator of comK gene [Metabacillus iocasae]